MGTRGKDGADPVGTSWDWLGEVWLMEGVEVPFDAELGAVLTAVGVRWRPGQPGNGRQGTMVVAMDREADGRLERLVAGLAGVRWGYGVGRELQLRLPLEGWADVD